MQTATQVQRWATELVDQALAVRQVSPPAGVRAVYADMYASLLGQVRDDADAPDLVLVAAWFYVPDQELLYAAGVKLMALVLAEEATLDDAVAALVVPADQRYGEALVTELATRTGPCLRVQQLVLDAAAAGGDSGVSSTLGHLWPLAEPGTFLVLMTTFASAVEGGLHEEAVDDFAAGVELEPAA